MMIYCNSQPFLLYILFSINFHYVSFLIIMLQYLSTIYYAAGNVTSMIQFSVGWIKRFWHRICFFRIKSYSMIENFMLSEV